MRRSTEFWRKSPLFWEERHNDLARVEKSILQLAIRGGLAEQDSNENAVNLTGLRERKTESFNFDLPRNWRLSHIETITNSIPPKGHQVLESEVLSEGRFPVISQSQSYIIGYSNMAHKVFRHEKPVVTFGDHTATVKLVKFDFIVGADGLKIFEPIYSVITAEFLFYVLQYYSAGLNKIGGYSRHYKYIKDKPIPLPPLAEQKRIVAKLEKLLPLCERLKY